MFWKENSDTLCMEKDTGNIDQGPIRLQTKEDGASWNEIGTMEQKWGYRTDSNKAQWHCPWASRNVQKWSLMFSPVSSVNSVADNGTLKSNKNKWDRETKYGFCPGRLFYLQNMHVDMYRGSSKPQNPSIELRKEVRAVLETNYVIY